MRCPSCDADNDEGRAVCSACGEPLTPYAVAVPADGMGAHASTKAREPIRRPVAVMVALAVDLLAAAIAIFCAFRALTSVPSLTEDATNYLSRAFGGLYGVVSATFFLAVAGGCLLLAWGTIDQRTWAWYAHAAIVGLAFLWLMVSGGILGVLAGVVVIGGAAWFWFLPEVRRWFGCE